MHVTGDLLFKVLKDREKVFIQQMIGLKLVHLLSPLRPTFGGSACVL